MINIVSSKLIPCQIRENRGSNNIQISGANRSVPQALEYQSGTNGGSSGHRQIMIAMDTKKQMNITLEESVYIQLFCFLTVTIIYLIWFWNSVINFIG
jgi:hypothetical protein